MSRKDKLIAALAEALEKIKTGCVTVREEKDIHADAHTLALEVIKDCNRALNKLEEARLFKNN